MRIGFIGTGNIASALVTGLSTLGESRHDIIVSPRNQEKSARLASEHANVRVGSSNQAVISDAELVVIALRPQIAMDVIGRLCFKESQIILTLVAATPVRVVQQAVSPAARVVRAVPLPSVAGHVGPILIYPDDREVVTLLEAIGEPFVIPEESQLSLLSTVTALISPFFALLDTVSGWAAKKGIAEDRAQAYTLSMFHALCEQAMKGPPAEFSLLAKEAATPGGLNEHAHALIAQKNGYQTFREALDAVSARIEGRGFSPMKDSPST